jgi:hypothetical protein
MELERPGAQMPDFAPLKTVLTAELAKLDKRAEDSPFSDHIIAKVLPLLSGLEAERFEEHFGSFVEMHRERLDGIYASHDFDLEESVEATNAGRVIHTPAALLVWERAVNGNQFLLFDHWRDEVYDGEFLLNDLLIQIGMTAP